MSNELTRVEDELYEEYRDIHNVCTYKSKEEFIKGLNFARYLMAYKDKSKAFNKVFGYHERAANLSTQLLTRKWMSMIMDRMQESQYALFLDKRLALMDEAYVVAMDKDEKTRDRVDAMKFFGEHTRKPDAIKVDIEVKNEIGVELADKIDQTLKLLSSNGQLYQNDGTITDVEVVID